MTVYLGTQTQEHISPMVGEKNPVKSLASTPTLREELTFLLAQFDPYRRGCRSLLALSVGRDSDLVGHVHLDLLVCGLALVCPHCDLNRLGCRLGDQLHRLKLYSYFLCFFIFNMFYSWLRCFEAISNLVMSSIKNL